MKITKKEFISVLSSSPHLLCGVEFVREIIPDRFDMVLTEIDNKPISGYDLRTVAARKSNHLVFSDGSRLYFDTFSKRMYFLHGSALAVVINENHSPMFKVIFYKIAAAKGN